MRPLLLLSTMTVAVIAGFSCTRPSPNQLQMERARAACIEAGIPAASFLVGDCVAKMQAALMPNPN